MPHRNFRLPGRGGAAAEHLAWAFYGIAAFGSSIGQIWVGVETPPWPPDWPMWIRAVMVLPFAVVIDLGGVVCSAFADSRQRLGEAAYGWRVLSAASVCLGVGINVVGHAHVPYLAVVFGGLGAFAYAVWLMHSAARRRDALRASGKLADTAPVYGIAQWWREPAVTRRAKSLALAYGYNIFESLTEARALLLREKNHSALTARLEQHVKSTRKSQVTADILVTSMSIGAIADKLMGMIDVDGWARYIKADLDPPAVEITASGIGQQPHDTDRPPGLETAGLKPLSSAVLRQIPAEQADYDRWRDLWQRLSADPHVSNEDAAAASEVSIRTVQRIREAGATGWLDSPLPPVVRLAALAYSNGHLPPQQPANL